MKHYEPKHIAALSDRGFYTILTVCGLIIAASAWVLWMHAGSSAETAVPETGAPVITPAEDVPDLTVQDVPQGGVPNPKFTGEFLQRSASGLVDQAEVPGEVLIERVCGVQRHCGIISLSGEIWRDTEK